MATGRTLGNSRLTLTDRRLLNQRIPFTAIITFTRPFGVAGATVLTDKLCSRFYH